MTEILNAKDKRQEILKGIIRDLHAGASPDQVKDRFARLIQNVTPSEIAQMEDELIKEGMPETEIRRLCDVHVAVFKESLDQQQPQESIPGHPVHTFRLENRALGQVIEELRETLENLGNGVDLEARREVIKDQLDRLSTVDKHYLRKENQLFPLLERRGVQGPPKVMWGIHDQIRAMLKEVRALAEGEDTAGFKDRARALLDAVADMIYKEENILFPMCMETLSEKDWMEVRAGEEEIGYALVTPGREWNQADLKEPGDAMAGLSGLRLDTGELLHEQINLMLKHLPLDMTFVDEKDRVRYYSAGNHRIFPRSPAIIGRAVQNCHPPDSVHVVNKIVEEFKKGHKDQADFWLTRDGRFIYITYLAVRDQNGEYRGVLEVTQDVTAVRQLQGEKRLLDW